MSLQQHGTYTIQLQIYATATEGGTTSLRRNVTSRHTAMLLLRCYADSSAAAILMPPPSRWSYYAAAAWHMFYICQVAPLSIIADAAADILAAFIFRRRRYAAVSRHIQMAYSQMQAFHAMVITAYAIRQHTAYAINSRRERHKSDAA